MKKIINLILSVLIFTLGYTTLNAAEPPSAKPFSVRYLGMGNTGIALANDQFLFYQNPAGLRTRKEGVKKNNGIISIFSFGVMTDIQAVQDIKEVVDVFSDAGDDIMTAIDQNKDKIKAIMGKNIGVGVTGPLMGGYVGNGWGFMIADAVDASIKVSKHAVPNLSIKGNGVTELKGGYAHSFRILKRNDLKVGAALKIFGRGDIDATYSLLDIESASDDIKDQIGFGGGLGLDIGVLYDLPILKGSRVAFTIDDFMTGYQKKKLDSDGNMVDDGIKRVEMMFNIGSYFNLTYLLKKVVPDYPKFVGVKGLFDIKGLFDTERNPNLGTKLHIGLEVDLWKKIYFRGGVNQGYFTGGIGFDIWVARLDYAYYQREAGLFPGNAVESLHAFSLNIAF